MLFFIEPVTFQKNQLSFKKSVNFKKCFFSKNQLLFKKMLFFKKKTKDRKTFFSFAKKEIIFLKKTKLTPFNLHVHVLFVLKTFPRKKP